MQGPGRFILVMLAWVLVLAACAPAAAQPIATATATPTAAPAITPDAAQPLVLVLPAVYEQKALVAANRHYSDAVKCMGWNVEFYTAQSYDAGSMETYLPYVSKQLCSGAARADGFLCLQYVSGTQEEPLVQAKANGQIYDCVAAAPQAVPQYWAKYQDQITAGKYGLVLAGQLTPVRFSDFTLVVRKDVLPLAVKGISGYDGLRALIAQLEQTPQAKACVQAYPQQLLNLWIMQQGYLELFSDAGIYARIDDPDAKPILLEDIPGFAQFLEDIVALQAHGLFRDPSYSSAYIGADDQPPTRTDTFGPVAALDYTYNFLFNNGAQGLSWKGYTAFPLTRESSYTDNISEAADADLLSRPDIMRELIIPARSRRAADAMAFIQWIYDDRRNADAVIYGQEGEDYVLQGERVALLGGRSSQDSVNMPSWQSWPGQYLFQLATERRIMADAPDNAESLLGAKPARPLAAPWLVHMSDGKAWESLMSRQSALCQTAINSFWSMSITPFDAGQFSEQLRAGATDSALQPYLDVLAEARTAVQP